MDVNKYFVFSLLILSLSELAFGIWLMTVDETMKCNLPCEIEYLDTSLWFIVKGLISMYLSLLLHCYIFTVIDSKCNLFVSTLIWILIFGHFIWDIIGCDVFWRCKGDTSGLDKNILILDILGGFILLVVHIKVMFDINQRKKKDNQVSHDYILTHV